MIVLYQFEISPFCDKIRRILHAKRQPYRVEEVRPSAAAAGRYRQISPTGKFPVLEHDGRSIVDSTDIALYLEDRFPTPALVPADPALRARVHVLEDWADESLYFYEMTMRLTWPGERERWIPTLLASESPWMQKLGPLLIPRAIERVTQAQGVGRKPREQVETEVSRHVAALHDWLGEGDWLVGDGLTLADIAVFAQLFCIRGTAVGERIIGADAVVSAWMARVDAATAAPGT